MKKSLWKKALSVLLGVCIVWSILVPLGAVAQEQVSISSISPTPMVRTDGMQEADIRLQNGGEAFSAWVKITVHGEPAYVMEDPITVGQGNSTATILVTDLNAKMQPGEVTDLTVELYSDPSCAGQPLASYETDQWERTRHWKFYLSEKMHTDIGYTDYQENLKERFSSHLDLAKQYIQNSEANENQSVKFKYAIESAFVLGESYMQKRNAQEIEEILGLIDEGSMTVAAGQFNYVTEAFTPEEAARATYYTNRKLVDELGIEPSATQYMFDNPAVSKGYVDVAAQAGIKYLMHSMNHDRSPYYQKKLYDLYYMEGMDPNNKLLIFNGEWYSVDYGFGGQHGNPDNGSVQRAQEELLNLIDTLTSYTGRRTYVYDKFPLALVPYSDNNAPMEGPAQVASDLNEAWQSQGYAYPTVVSAFADQFFEEVEAEYGDLIPVETGTEENWWNDGWATTAYESGTNKEAGNLLPVAESAASLASVLTGQAYPTDRLQEAYERNIIYDEHTWGNASYDGGWQYQNQFEWKRSNAFGAKALGEEVLGDSLDALASQVQTQGKAVYVYNPLNWSRDDVVTVSSDGLPEHFLLKDGGQSLPYRVEDGQVTFVVSDVPALGYKTIQVEEVEESPTFDDGVQVNGNTMENEFYKVTFAADGTIQSILDKQNGNRELVNQADEAKFNQYRYYDDHGVPMSNQPGGNLDDSDWTMYTPAEGAATLTVEADGIGATGSVDTSTFRANSIVQKVTLYKGIPRIDIVNEVVKESLPSLQTKEEAFYTFPFAVSDDFEIRYDLPVGNVAEGSPVYGTSTDWYSVGKWVNVEDKSDGYNIALALPNTSLVQFGERRTHKWSFDYKSDNPTIYSYIMNNMWQTNFQADQPGYADFRYSLSTNQSGVDQTARFAWEISTPLQATVIEQAQPDGTLPAQKTLLGISADNVQLSTMKASEANGDGMILRFYELQGKESQNVTVTLPVTAQSVVETDVIENDKGEAIAQDSNTFTFDIPAYGIKTFRVRFGEAPSAVEGVQAITVPSAGNVNLSTGASVTASSVYDGSYAANNAVSVSDGSEWASKGEINPWIQFDWDSPIEIGKLVIADRPNSDDDIDRMELTFSDGSSMTITDIPGSGQAKEVVLDTPKTVTWIKAQLYGGSRAKNTGLSGLECYAPGTGSVSLSGTSVTWQPVEGALYYEIFRSNSPDFEAGSGNVLGATASTTWFDTQVVDGMTYYYRVRAAFAGAKGEASQAVSNLSSSFEDTQAPDTPILDAVTREDTRIDLWWTPSTDNVAVVRYDIYRDGQKIGSTNDGYVCTYRDWDVQPGTQYQYTVRAVDSSGNQSAQSNAVERVTYDWSKATLAGLEVSQGTLSPAFDSLSTTYTANVGHNFERLSPVVVTPTAADPDAIVTVNGKIVESGQDSQPIAIQEEGDQIVVKVVSGDASKVYLITFRSGDPILTVASGTQGSAWENDRVAGNLINNSGMSGTSSLQDTHDNNGGAYDMWHTNANPGENAWVEFDLGQVTALDEMWIWNMNQHSGGADETLRGLKNVKIQYRQSQEDDWIDLQPEEGMSFPDSVEGYPFQFAKASGEEQSPATNLNDGNHTPVRFHGVEARYVRITAHPDSGVGSWGDIYFGLSEVRFTKAIDLEENIPVESILVSSLEGEDTISQSGGTLSMQAVLTPEDATYQNVTWSVVNEEGGETDLAVITEDGLLTARKNGTVLVRAATTDPQSDVYGEMTVTITGQKEVISGVTAAAGSMYEGESSRQKPVNLVNDSGMSGSGSVVDTHDNHGSAVTMWHTEANPGSDAWVEFDLGDAYPIDEMWIWNLNQSGNTGRGLKDVKIQYKVNEDDPWTELRGEGSDPGSAYPYRLAQASGQPGQPATNLDDGQNSPIRFENKVARYVRITADPVPGQGTWGDVYYGLSEVRFTLGQGVDKSALTQLIDQAEDKVENQYTSESWEPFAQALEEAQRIQNQNDATQQQVDQAAENLKNAMDALEPLPQDYTVTADKSSYSVNETITLTVTSPLDVDRLGIFNENGKAIGLTKLQSRVEGRQKVWTVRFSLGTAGDRTLTLQAYRAGQWTETGASIHLDVDADKLASAAIYEATFHSTTVGVNQPVQVTVVTSGAVSKLAVTNERDRAISFTVDEVTPDADSRLSWTITLSVGSAGMRILNFKAVDINGGIVPVDVQASIVVTAS